MPSQYLTVRIGQTWHGIPLASVTEVLHMVALTELPASHPAVLGALTLRNCIMPVIDLRICFKRQDTSLRLSTPIVTVNVDGRMMGFVVDEVDRVVTIDQDAADQVIDTPYLTGAVQLEAGTLLIVDVESFFELFSGVKS